MTELKETESSNISSHKTFESFDTLELKGFAENLQNLITTECKYTDGGLIISLNAPFGSGKTCFLEMFQNYLQKEPLSYEVLYINAWKSDFYDDPLTAVSLELIEHIDKRTQKKDDLQKKAKNALLNFVGAFAMMGNQMLKHKVGIDIKEAAKAIEDDNQLRELGNKIFDNYENRKNLTEEVNKTLTAYTQGMGKVKLVVIIDELDRARPDYAVKFLEALKHFFSTQGIVFLLGIDRDQLKSSVECLYGRGINFQEYYRKFVHRNLDLPSLQKHALQKYIEKRIGEHFTAAPSDNKFLILEMDAFDRRHITDMCSQFKLTPRQIDEMFRILSYSFSTNKPVKAVRGWILATILYTATMMNNADTAKQIRNGKFGYSDFLNLFDNQQRILDNNHAWLDRVILLISINSESRAKDEEIFIQRYNSINRTSPEYEKRKSGLYHDAYSLMGMGWDVNDISMIRNVAQEIESCKLFGT